MVMRALVALGAFMMVGASDAPPLAALSRIETGQWTLRALDGRSRPRNMCIADARVLLQLQHSGVACSRYVIANDPMSTTVHYTCPGAGHGRTTIRVETPRLIRIESQGIAAGDPFDWSVEARRSGACPGNASR